MCHRARLSVCLSVCLSVPKTESATVGPLPFMRDDRRATGRWLRETGERRRRERSAVPGFRFFSGSMISTQKGTIEYVSMRRACAPLER